MAKKKRIVVVPEADVVFHDQWSIYSGQYNCWFNLYVNRADIEPWQYLGMPTVPTKGDPEEVRTNPRLRILFEAGKVGNTVKRWGYFNPLTRELTVPDFPKSVVPSDTAP